ncbi:unnamed protein product [Ranitomeya imitator]|uniref:Uncharacterized protein n=1 Tax=Ranitomeya imitator TaxID=111125 RepID=A0ABN9KX87_9NEOB|nr:unnamed protein product [Ranitomeya imitator]
MSGGKRRLLKKKLQAFSELLLTGRLDASSTDVRPYVVDGRVYLAELFHGLKKHYYWTPTYGISNDPLNNSSLTIMNNHTF